MAVTNPFRWLSPSTEKRAFVVLFALGAILMVAWSATNAPLRTAAAPRGILSFEFAGTWANARSIIDSWDRQAQVNAGVNLGLDYLFLIAYSGSIALACVVLAEKLGAIRWISSLGFLLAWVQFAGALADSTENYALIQLLRGADDSWLPGLARTAATIKGVCSGVGIAYVIGGIALLVLGRFFPGIVRRLAGSRAGVSAPAPAKTR